MEIEIGSLPGPKSYCPLNVAAVSADLVAYAPNRSNQGPVVSWIQFAAEINYVPLYDVRHASRNFPLWSQDDRVCTHGRILCWRFGCEVSRPKAWRPAHSLILTQQTWKHFFHVRYERIQAQDGRCQNLLSAESQQLAGQRGSALARFFDFRGIFVGVLILVQGLLQYTAIPDDDSEQIAKIMGDPSR